MPLARIQRSFPSLPFTQVNIRDTFGTPARLYVDASGRFPMETIGSTLTSASGVLDVYVDDSRIYNLELRVNGVVLERINGVDPQGLVELQHPFSTPIDGNSINLSRNWQDLILPTYFDSAPADGPTVVATGATAPGSTTAYANDNPAFDYLGPGAWFLRTDPVFVRPAIGASYCRCDWATSSPDFYLRQENNNNRQILFYDELDGQGWKFAAAMSMTAAGTREHTRVTFAARKMRKFSLRGFNLTFGGILMTAGDDLTRATSSRPILMVMGDSYTQGTGALGQALTFAGYLAECLGYELYADGIGSTGWNTGTPNSPAERVFTNGPANLVRRNAGVDSPVIVSRMAYALGYNDSAGNQSTLQASVDATLAACAAAGVVKPFFFGPWTPMGDTTNLTTTEASIQSRALFGGAQFVSIRGVITPTNRATLTAGDNVHPTAFGHKVLGYTLAQRVRSAGIA